MTRVWVAGPPPPQKKKMSYRTSNIIVTLFSSVKVIEFFCDVRRTLEEMLREKPFRFSVQNLASHVEDR